MRLVIRDLVKKDGDTVLLNGAGYTFWPGYVYGIVGESEESKRALLDCINYEVSYEDGYIELNDNTGKNVMNPSMIGQMLEEPSFPEFLTIAEFVKYFIDMNKKNIPELKTKEEYLSQINLDENSDSRLIKDMTYEERVRLQFLCFMIYSPSVIIIEGIKNIRNMDFLKQIKGYLDDIKSNSIILMLTKDVATTQYLCDETIIVDNGIIRGGN